MPTASRNVVDSSAWLEFFSNGPNADVFAPVIQYLEGLIVPTIVITEVLRRLDVEGRQDIIPEVLAHLRQGLVVALDDQLAVDAVSIGRRHRLALADSIVYTTALALGGTVWTQDEDFKDLPQVEYREHPSRRG
ncbi:MAG TPA: type II toxin-antitoxin system VapC family toxin [Thermoanaerobaculia bacterium]|nr:type II toxin-antitoxin system VapC family toxin [Thermoanaerobaculia bacterium]